MASSSSSSPELSTALAASSSQETSLVYYSNLSRKEVFEDLSSRFILNLPKEELASVERVCFQVEQAHWYYEDFVREQNPSMFPSYNLKNFSELFFRECPVLSHRANDHDRAFAHFMQYKTRVPVCGAIMLNDTWDKCVLVKGWKASAGWGFPKGKINEQEPKHRCAIREVLEETGYDLENQLDPENVIELSIREQSISLYVVPGVPEDFPFQTRTRKEISKIAWFRLSDLPTWKRNKGIPGKFYLISPFIAPLKAFIHDRKPKNLPRRVIKPQVTQAPNDSQASSEEDVTASIEQSPSSLVDPNSQESSSQSSADNGEPHTPSPQYSEAPVHQVVFDAETLPYPTTNGLDPALARLVDRLALSAYLKLGEPESKVAEEPKLKANIVSETMPSASSLPSTQPSSQSIAVSDSYSARPATVVYQHESPPHIASPPTASAPSTEHTPIQVATSSPHAAPATSPSLKAPGHGRRSSTSTADLSPYLSRPKGITKEMKYISMLESVAQESDRVASRMGHRPPIPTPQGPISYPQPPPSVPPDMIYQSTPPAMPHLARPFPPQMPYSPLPMNGFSVRPSTSLALHHPPTHPAMVPRQSMNEAQLRALLPLHSGPGPTPGFSTPFPPPAPRPPMNVNHVAPPHRAFQPSIAPLSHNPEQFANNARLLSILNTPNPVFRA